MLLTKHVFLMLGALAAILGVASGAFGLTISALSPTDYEVDVFAQGVEYYADAAHSVTGVPLALAEGMLIRTEANDASNPGLLVSFDIDARSMVYVCYDSRAAAPSWLSSWVDTGMEVGVSDGAVGHYKVYAKRFNAGAVQLQANQASAMYFVVVKESLPQLPRKGWVLLSYDMPYLREIIRKAPEYDVNTIQISHDLMMNTYYVTEQPARRADINEIIGLAHAYGITEVTLWTHEVCTHGMPSEYRAPAGHPAAGHADGNNPAMWAWIQQRYIDLFTAGTGCPEADGIILTFSEVDDNVYQHEGDGNPGLPAGTGPEFKHDGYTQQQSVAMLIDTLQQVLAPRGKSLYARTWGSSGDKWEQPIIRDGILLNGDTSVWMMNKNVGGVDWPHMDTYQPLIGSLPPEYNELIEFDMGAEYFGRSATTYVLTSYFKDHWSRALSLGADGAVARIDREGGIAYYSANRINLYALKEVLANPDCDPQSVNLAWCLQHFPPGIAQDIADHYDDPNSPWEGDTRYMMWEAYFGGVCPITVSQALDIAYAAIDRVDRHWLLLSLQTTLDTRTPRNDFQVLHDGIVTAITKLGGTVPDSIPPTAPTNVQVEVLSSTSARVTWSAATDNVVVSGYRVYRSGTLAGTSALTTLTDTGLQASAIYSYTVTAFDGKGNESAHSAPPVEITSSGPDLTAPSVPASVQATTLSSTSIRVSWAASTDDTGVAGYKVYRNGMQIAASVSTTYTDAGLTPNVTYSYRVSAYDADGNSSAQSSPAATATTHNDTVAPSAPSGVAATATSSTTIGLRWTASTDASSGVAGYRIYRNGVQVGTCAATVYTDTGLSPGVTYSYRVSAYDYKGNSSSQSSPSAAATTFTGWSYSAANPLIFEFADNGDSFYDDPVPGGGDLLPYDTFADPPHAGVKFCWGRQDSTWRHTFSSAGTGSFALQSNGNNNGRALVFARHNVDGNQFTLSGLDWAKGIVYEIKAKSVGDLSPAYWPDGYSWGGNYSTGGAEYNFYTLTGNPPGAPSDSSDTGLVISWQTKDPTNPDDDRVSLNWMSKDGVSAKESVGLNYPLGGDPENPPEHVYKLTARRSPLPWQQQNDTVLVNLYVDDTLVIRDRTTWTYADNWGDGVVLGTRRFATSPHGNVYDWVKLRQADAISDTDRPSHPTGVTIVPESPGVTLSWSAATDPTSQVIGYRIKRNGSYIAYVDWVATSYADAGGTIGDSYDIHAVDAVGNESYAPPIPGVAMSPQYANATPIVVSYYGAADRSGTGLKYVHLYYKKGSSGAWTDSGLATVTSGGSFNFVSVSGEGVYYFALRAEDNAGNWSPMPQGNGDDNTIYDPTPPTAPTVTDDGAFTTMASQIHAAWAASDVSGIAEYQYAISSTSSESGIILGGNWQTVGVHTQATRTGLSLAYGQVYYVLVKAKNGMGAWSAVGVSDGITVVENTPATLGEAKGLADGETVGLADKLVAAVFGDCLYVQEADRSAGLRVEPSAPIAGLATGRVLDVGGTIWTSPQGERYLACGSARLVQ